MVAERQGTIDMSADPNITVIQRRRRRKVGQGEAELSHFGANAGLPSVIRIRDTVAVAIESGNGPQEEAACPIPLVHCGAFGGRKRGEQLLEWDHERRQATVSIDSREEIDIVDSCEEGTLRTQVKRECHVRQSETRETRLMRGIGDGKVRDTIPVGILQGFPEIQEKLEGS